MDGSGSSNKSSNISRTHSNSPTDPTLMLANALAASFQAHHNLNTFSNGFSQLPNQSQVGSHFSQHLSQRTSSFPGPSLPQPFEPNFQPPLQQLPTKTTINFSYNDINLLVENLHTRSQKRQTRRQVLESLHGVCDIYSSSLLHAELPQGQ